MNLIFLGFPGSGKGTVAKMINNFNQMSTGDLLRKEISSGSDLGKEIAEIINKGNLVSDELALRLIKVNFDSSLNYIFDGFPRKLSQAKLLTNLIGTEGVAVLFDIKKEVLVERIVNRRSCKKCGEIFNLKFKPPKVADTCDNCRHVGLTHREDDKIETLSKRLEIFINESPEIIEYYKSLGKLIVVNADQDMPQVLAEFKKKVGV